MNGKLAWLLILALLSAAPALAQDSQLENRPVSDVRAEGLKLVPEQLARNQIRLQVGDPYQPTIVEQDVVRLTHLGRFNSVTARVEPQADGSVVVVYVFDEQRLLADVQVVGNKQKSDQELRALVLLRTGDPIDSFLIDRGKQQIERAYADSGFFLTDVTIDQELLDESSILIYRVREGPKVRIRGVKFEGNTTFTDDELRSKIRSKSYILLFRSGALSRERLDEDVSRLRDYYRERGYLDAQVGRRIDISPNQKDAVVVFVVEEGRQYIVSDVQVEGVEALSDEQVRGAIPLQVGDIFSQDRLRQTQQVVQDMYGKLGYIRARVEVQRLFHETNPTVSVVVRVNEGMPYTVGRVSVRGNELTKEQVVLRQLRGVEPGRRFDGQGMRVSERRLGESALFQDAKIVVLGDDADPVRDVLVDVKEKNTGSLSFGAGISSDAGVLGAIDLTQRNFDIGDWPDSFDEFIRGRAFRGAGQYFSLTLQPGNEFSRYSVSFREPYLFESQYFFDTNLFYFTREREHWDEERLGGRLGIGQRFGDVWTASVNAEIEEIGVEDIEDDAPIDAFDVEGNNLLTQLTLRLGRVTTDSRIFPTRGSAIELVLGQAGALGGDFTFTRVGVEYRKFWTVDEDFFGRRTVLSLRTEMGYIFGDEAPLFERFYAGGHRSIRGFRYRGVSPRGKEYFDDDGDPNTDPIIVQGDEPVGGDWLFLLGLEYNFPIFGQPTSYDRSGTLNGVVFIDTGTVQDDFGFDEYRASIGAGIRLKVPFLGQAPFALDLAYPLLSESEDDKQIFSFDLALPLR